MNFFTHSPQLGLSGEIEEVQDMVTLGEEELLICSQELQILIAAVVANGFHLHSVNEWITDGMESELAVSMCCIGL